MTRLRLRFYDLLAITLFFELGGGAGIEAALAVFGWSVCVSHADNLAVRLDRDRCVVMDIIR